MAGAGYDFGIPLACVAMAEQYRVTITLSPKAYEEMEMVAGEKGIPLAKHLGMIVESHHETPAYGNLVKRAMAWGRGMVFEGGGKFSDGNLPRATPEDEAV